MAKRPTKTDTTGQFPIFLDDDLRQRLRELSGRSDGLAQLHNHVLAFLLPEQQRLSRETNRFWEEVHERHHIPRGVAFRVIGSVLELVPESS